MEHGREHGRQPRRTPRWGRAAALSTGATALLVLGVGAGQGLSRGFLAAVAAALTVQVALLVVLDRREESGSLTPATAVTVLRGSAAVALAGFLFSGRPEGLVAWLPACLFGAAVALDAADGALARATDSTSAFGAALDVETDALAVLVGVLVAVRTGQAPAVFLAVGLARYAFLAAATFRRYRGSRVGSLPPRASRRVLGAAQMVVLALVLAPMPGATVSHLLAVAVMGPVLAGFVRDWLLVR